MLGSKMESNDVAKSSHVQNLGILFSLINMAGMAEPAHCRVRSRVMVWSEGRVWYGQRKGKGR